MMNQLACHLRYALIVLAAGLLIILLSRWTGKNNFAPTYATTLSPADVKTVVDEASLANQAAHSQTNKLDALLDVTTALATLNTATSLAGKEPVTQAAGVPLRTLEHELAAHQRQLMLELDAAAAPAPAHAPHPLQPLPKI